HDVGMIEPANGLQLPTEPGQRLGIVLYPRQLNGNVPAEQRVLRQVHRGHPSHPKPSQDLVAPGNSRTGKGGGVGQRLHEADGYGTSSRSASGAPDKRSSVG